MSLVVAFFILMITHLLCVILCYLYKILYLIFNYPHKYYTFKYFKV